MHIHGIISASDMWQFAHNTAVDGFLKLLVLSTVWKETPMLAV